MEEIVKLKVAKDVAEDLVMQFRSAFLNAGESAINGSRGLHNYEKYKDWLWLVKECEKSDNELLGVQATTYFAVREPDNKIIGCIELRHTLNESLQVIGGHIGYSVIPTERKKGYATKMLKLVLEEAKKLRVDKLLLTCDADNIGSNKTILNCGGVLEREEPFDYEGEIYYKYWISL